MGFCLLNNVALAARAAQAAGERSAKLGDGAWLGRAEGCDISLDSMYVSNRHAVVSRANGSVKLADAGSANGIFVGGEKVKSAFPEYAERLGDDGMISIDGIVDGFEFLYRQPRRAWSFEIDVRTHLEKW